MTKDWRQYPIPIWKYILPIYNTFINYIFIYLYFLLSATVKYFVKEFTQDINLILQYNNMYL